MKSEKLAVRGKTISGRKSNICNDPEAGKSLVFEKLKVASVAGM